MPVKSAEYAKNHKFVKEKHSIKNMKDDVSSNQLLMLDVSLGLNKAFLSRKVLFTIMKFFPGSFLLCIQHTSVQKIAEYVQMVHLYVCLFVLWEEEFPNFFFLS